MNTPKLVITSIVQFADLSKRHPAILNLNSFITIKDVIDKALNKPGCKCNVGKDLVHYRPQFETAMAILTPDEQTQLKALLNADVLCYYQKDLGGKLKQICF